MKIHSMPYEFGFQFIFYSIPVLILCSFIIKISNDPDLWWRVIESVDMSPIILLIAWGISYLTVILIAVGLTIILTKDRKTIKTD